MDILKYTTKVRKGQHLTAEERHDICGFVNDVLQNQKTSPRLIKALM